MNNFVVRARSIFSREKWKITVIGIIVLLAVGLIIAGRSYAGPFNIFLAAQQCRVTHSVTSERITCWHNIIADEMARSGIPSAINAFASMYRWFPEFADSGCHFQAHRVGDLAYYSYFVAEGLTLSDIEFPDSTAACGNGFFHGFLEHLIQARPTAKVIESECESLIAKQEDVNPRIRIACYHASGHGLARAEYDRLSSENITDLRRFFVRPLAECERITEVESIERENCSQGVLNVVVNWMSINKFGLSIPSERPFSICEELFVGSKYYNQCLVEISRKIDGLSGQNPKEIIRMLDQVALSEELRSELIAVAIAGVIQQIVGDGDPVAVLRECENMSKPDYRACQSGIVRGLILNGSPRSEIGSVAEFCRSQTVRESGDVSLCWRTAGLVLREFYDENTHNKLCQSLKDNECAYFKSGEIDR